MRRKTLRARVTSRPNTSDDVDVFTSNFMRRHIHIFSRVDHYNDVLEADGQQRRKFAREHWDMRDDLAKDQGIVDPATQSSVICLTGRQFSNFVDQIREEIGNQSHGIIRINVDCLGVVNSQRERHPKTKGKLIFLELGFRDGAVHHFARFIPRGEFEDL